MLKKYLTQTVLIIAIGIFTTSCDKEAPTGTFIINQTEAIVGDVISVTLTAEDNRKIDAYRLDLIINKADGQNLDTIEVFLGGRIKSISESYQYTIPATVAGDSILSGCVFIFNGDVWDKKSKNFNIDETVTIL